MIAKAVQQKPARATAKIADSVHVKDTRVLRTGSEVLTRLRELAPKKDSTPSPTDFERGHATGWNSAVEHLHITIATLERELGGAL